MTLVHKINCNIEDCFEIKNSKIELNSFIFSYNKTNYLVTVNHSLPITECSKGIETLAIIKYPIWNELLICNPGTMYPYYQSIKKYKTKIPILNEKLHINTFRNNVILEFADIRMLKLHNLPTNPTNIYFSALVIDGGTIYESMSGSPVFDDNGKLIGIFSKKEIKDNKEYALIIPAYYLIKTLTKTNNDSIFEIEFDESITKINNYIVKNNYIYHPSFGINILIDTWTMIEGDDNIKIKVNNNDCYNFIDINNYLQIINSNKLVYKDKKILINSTLLRVLKLYFNSIVCDVINIIKVNKKIKYIDLTSSLEIIEKKCEKIPFEIYNINLKNKYYNFKFMFDETF
jgi:hypothetical protein